MRVSDIALSLSAKDADRVREMYGRGVVLEHRMNDAFNLLGARLATCAYDAGRKMYRFRLTELGLKVGAELARANGN